MVWGACMVFFQAALLAGYFFTHILIQKIGINRYRLLYLGLLLVPLLFFPGRDLVVSTTHSTLPLAMDVFWQLLFTIGPVFFVLSTVSIFTQVWLASSELSQRSNPYALYSWSNLGSFAGLLTYPFFFELFWDLSQQILIWRMMYLILIGVSLASYMLVGIKSASVLTTPRLKSSVISRNDILMWMLLSGGGVMMFLSVTNIMTMEIAPMPLLWIMPLAVYLLAFVLNFKRVPWCPSWINSKIHYVIGFGVLFYFFFQLSHYMIPILIKVLVLMFLLFVVCMYCQNQLLKRKPADNHDLTFFYLIISLGGFIGGFLTSWVIPIVCASIAEYLVALALITLTLTPKHDVKVTTGYMLRLMAYLMFLLFAWPMQFQEPHVWGVIFLFAVCFLIFKQLKKGPHALTLTLLVTLVLLPYLEMAWENKVFIYKERNYYGIYKVFHKDGMTDLLHGTILHGMQFQDPQMKSEPTSYYGQRSPLGLLLSAPIFESQRIGAVGLGVGTLSVYAKSGQIVDFYELDPDMVRIAQQYFTFTKDTPAQINYIVGDARLSLVKNPEVKYDILIIDAFSGDSVPVHLLTAEMIDIYRRHLTKKGILLFHVTNRYLQLDKIVTRAAQSSGAWFCYQKTENPEYWEIPSDWMALTWDEGNFHELTTRLRWKSIMPDNTIRLWTDQYTSVMPIFKWKSLIDSLIIFVQKN